MAKTVAGSSTKLNPKVPNRSGENENYELIESVNQGPAGARKGSVTPGHGQSTSDMASKNQLISIADQLQDPYRARGEQFPDGKTSADAAHGQGSGATWDNRDGGGKNQLCDDSENQGGPRFAEDDGCGETGAGTPVPGDRAARVAANFPVDRNRGEGRSEGGQTGIDEYIDLQTGHVCTGDGRTVVQEVPQNNVSIPTSTRTGSKVGRVARDLK